MGANEGSVEIEVWAKEQRRVQRQNFHQRSNWGQQKEVRLGLGLGLG